ncbi:MAG: FIG01121071: hypothetical protein [uncultured Acidimicrobiales bacterium]|uniref:Uncharacterized protein n=1 Tax=uncultured Acidimicrobiales bacterium TaxID=310071 RepID=A0A6J4IAW3_9ACTN|nr:MAG: FIG01121071: hypothetical protein [uncultured Acidimicrobiales bacterium]
MSWDELVAGALVGTARRPPAIPAAEPGSALGDVLAAIDPTDAEGAVLTAGAVLGLYRQAGVRLPADNGPPPPASPPEVRPHCSEAAAYRLDVMLAGRFRPVLEEWLGLVAGSGRLVPPDRLPGLLQTASTSPALRPGAAEVMGERGRWLANLNPVWAWAAGGAEADDAGTWATGSAAARRLLLGRIRATDPGVARELLVSTWATETPEDRAAFLAVLATGLSMDDEPFLEAALDDRRKEVRLAAAGLLWRLPESRLAGRMAERARPLVRISRRRVESILPDSVDEATVRDGVVVKPPAGTGERAWWFHQLVAATPLKTWPDSPDSLVVRADPLLKGAWAAAAARQRDEAWALALLDTDDVDEPALLEAVPHQRAVEVTTERVARLGLTPAVVDLLVHCPPPWGPELSGAAVDRLGVTVRRQGRPDSDAVLLRARLADLGVRLDPSVAGAAAAELADHAPWWSDVVGWFLDLLTFRAEMREELPS